MAHSSFEINDDFDNELFDSKQAENSPHLSTTRWINISGILAIIVTLSIMTSSNIRTDNNSSYLTNFLRFYSDDSTSYSIDVSVTSPGYDTIDSLTYLPWDVIVEPYREQVFNIQSFTVNGEVVTLSSDYSVVWVIDGITYNDLSPVVVLTTLGVQDGSVTITPPESSAYSKLKQFKKGSSTSSKFKLNNPNAKDIESAEFQTTFSMAVKYVRREIRSLTEDDRNDVFAAMNILYNVDDSTGKTIYGDKYRSAEYFAAVHLLGGGRTDCDHFHDGAGVAVTHISMTLAFEQSLQSINPKIALPYWEYTLDNYLYSSVYDSIVWQPSWFGDLSPDNSYGTIRDGSYWSNITVPSGDKYHDWDIASTGSLQPYVNAYNQLRSPWNNIPNDGISRFSTVYGDEYYTSYPSCSTLYEAFSQSDLEHLNQYLNSQTHGPTHILIGGAVVFDDSVDNYKWLQSPNKLLAFKVLWRMGYTRCPTTCSSADDCKCSIPQQYIDKYGSYQILVNTGIATEFSLSADESDDYYLDILRALEDPGVAGEMFSSNAAYDPSFWFVHGTMDRMVAFKRILSSQGDTTFTETWGYPPYTISGDFYLDGVCDWSAVSSVDDLTLPNCDSSATCYGHGETDALPVDGFIDSETYTNAEFYSFMHPWTEEYLYVYDTYGYDYCKEYDDIDFLSGITDELTYRGVKRGRAE